MARGPEVQHIRSTPPRRSKDYDLLRLVKELEWLRTLAHVSPVAIFRADARGRFCYVNARWSELTGCPVQMASGANWDVSVHPEDVPLLRAEWRRCLAERVPFTAEHRFLQPSGRVVWVLTEVVRDVDGIGRTLGYSGTSTETTELRAMREELQRSHLGLEIRMRDRSAELQRMARIVESIDDAVVSADLDGRVLSWNRGAEEIFGYTAAEMIGQPVFVLCPPEALEEAHRFEEAIRGGGEIHRFETSGMTRTGKRLRMAISGFALREVDGTITGSWAIMRDITERKRAEEALRQSEERLRLALDNGRHGLWDWDIVTGSEYLDEQWYAIHGYAFLERPAQYELWADSLHPDDRERVMAAMEEHLIAGDAPYDVDYRARTKCGEWIWINSRGRVHQRDAQGKPLRMMGTICDITERKRGEHTLQHLSRRLMRLQDEERRRLARDLHDSTAQSVAALSMNLSLLARENPALPEPRRRQLLKDSMELAEQATSELRTTSYLLHPPLLDERGLPAALRWFAEGFAERSGIKVELTIDPGLARLAPEVETAIFRVTQESLHNVHRHSGSKLVQIRLGVTDGALQLEVRDRGRGLGTETGEIPGVGIAGMKERLLQLGGTLSLEANHPGTAVIAHLPLVE